LQKFLRRKHFAADDAVKVGDKAFDFGDAVFFDPGCEFVLHETFGDPTTRRPAPGRLQRHAVELPFHLAQQSLRKRALRITPKM
jgi:hypothetical protein